MVLDSFFPASLAAMESLAFAGSSAAKAGHPAKRITKAQYKADAIRKWCFIIDHVSFAPSPFIVSGQKFSGHYTPTSLPLLSPPLIDDEASDELNGWS